MASLKVRYKEYVDYTKYKNAEKKIEREKGITYLNEEEHILSFVKWKQKTQAKNKELKQLLGKKPFMSYSEWRWY